MFLSIQHYHIVLEHNALSYYYFPLRPLFSFYFFQILFKLPFCLKYPGIKKWKILCFSFSPHLLHNYAAR